MSGIVALIEATPRRPTDGGPVTVRLCWNAVSRADFFGQQWYPGLVTLPTFETSLGFDGERFGQGATPTVGALVIGIDPVTAPLAGLVWKNASVILRTAPRPRDGDPADGDFTVAWTGRADTLAEKEGGLTIVALDAGQALRRPVQPVLFGASGSALLDGADAVDKAGQTVPLGWGALSSVPGILVDKSYNIWLLLGRPAAAIAAIEDGGAPFTPGVARASLADLRATPPAAGAADYCLDADGLVLTRPWTAPTYPLIADLTAAGSATAAGIAAAIVGARSALAFTAGTVAAFDALLPATCQLYVADGRTVAEALDLIFPPLGAYWKLNSAGTIDLGRLTRAPAATRDLGTARFGDVTRLGTVLPTGRRTLGYATSNRVLGDNEIAKILTADNATAIGGVPAATILGEIDTASAQAAAATAELAAISSDNVLTPVEKAVAIRDADVIAGEQAGLDAQALAFGVTTEKAAYDAAVAALAAYLGGLVAPTVWNDLTGNTNIVGPTFRAKFAAAFEARSTLLAAIAAAAALWQNQSGATKPSIHRVRARGFYSTLPSGNAYRPGLWNEDAGTQLAGNASMWTVAYVDAPPASWVFLTFNPRDNTGAGGGTDDLAAMVTYLGGIRTYRPGTALIVYSFDDPFARFNAALIDELCHSGAVRSKLTGPGVQRNGAYVLVTNAGSAEGAGMDYYQGSFDAGAGHSDDAAIDVTFTLSNGRVLLGGQTPSTAADLSYSGGGTVDALKPATAGADATAPVLVAKAIQDGATRNVNRGAWAPGPYVVGDLVTFGDPVSAYHCDVAHTAVAGSPPPNANFSLYASAGGRGADGLSAVLQGSVDGATGWHAPPTAGDVYQRASNDGGATFGAAYRVKGDTGPTGPAAPAFTKLGTGTSAGPSVFLAAGASVSFAVAVNATAGGSGGGTCVTQAQASVAGANSWTVFGSVSSQNIATEPIDNELAATFTNTTDTGRAFDFRVVNTGFAGRAAVADQCYMRGA